MKTGLIPKVNSATEFHENISHFIHAGIPSDSIVINCQLDELMAKLDSGDTIVVLSYADIFSSLTAMFEKLIDFAQYNISIESIAEPTLKIESTQIDLMRALCSLDCLLRHKSTCKGLARAKADGKILGRPFGMSSTTSSKITQVDQLCISDNVSVSQACLTIGCNIRTYYRHKQGLGIPKQQVRQARIK